MAVPFPLAINTVGTLAAGHIVLDTEWNAAVGGLYTYINNTLLTAGLNAVNTKGDMYVFDGSALSRLGVGTDGQVLVSNSAAAAGIDWESPVNTLALLNTKGDTVVYDGSQLQRLPVGTDGQVLTVDSGESNGIKWADPTSVPLGGIIMWFGAINALPTGFSLCDGNTHNGYATPNLQGVFPVGAGSNSPASGGLGILAVGATGGATSHIHALPAQLISAASGAGVAIGSIPVGSSTYFGDAVPPYVAVCFIMRTS